MASDSELAHTEIATLEEESCKRVVGALYDALSAGDFESVQQLLAPDLEWWFHGPPTHQHLMRLLTGTGTGTHHPFHFRPLSLVAFGSTVLVEGYDRRHSVAWVHAWLLTDGIITQLREYFNTSVTVTRLSKNTDAQSSSAPSVPCPCLWQSKVCESMGKSVPGLLLALQ